MALEILMKGSDYSKHDTYNVAKFSDNVVAGISAGSSKNAKKKYLEDKTNEDSLAVATLPDD